MEKITESLIVIICKLISDIHSYIGIGEKYANTIDNIATKDYDSISTIFGGYRNINVLSIEGERDGILCSKLQDINNYKDINNYNNTSVQVVIDPIDGTKTGSLGGSRCLSAIAINTKKTKSYKKVPDSLSCFYTASNLDNTLTDNFTYSKLKSNLNRITNEQNIILSTIRRAETEELFNDLLETNFLTYEKGEKNFYMQSILYDKIYMAGDSSLPLFLESDCFIGRTGISEAMIEARLWKSWRGLIVSGSKMKQYKQGQLEYIKNRIYAAYGKKFNLLDFFEKKELELLYSYGWNDIEIIKMHCPDSFVPDYEIIIIASITGTKDNIFSKHSKINMERIKVNNNEMKINFYIRENGIHNLTNIIYNYKENTFYEKKI